MTANTLFVVFAASLNYQESIMLNANSKYTAQFGVLMRTLYNQTSYFYFPLKESLTFTIEGIFYLSHEAVIIHKPFGESRFSWSENTGFPIFISNAFRKIIKSKSNSLI